MLGLLLLSSAANAVDLTTVVVAWEHTETGQAGSDDDDRATDAALDASGNVVVVGWLDGSAASAHDALAVSFDPDGVERWRAVHDTSVGEPLVSDDRWYAIALDPATGDTALCGHQGSSDRTSDWLVELYTADLADQAWSFAYDEGLASDTQSCRGISFDDDHLATVGATFGDDDVAGQWRGIAMQRGAQPLVLGLWTYDPFDDADVPDEPTSVTVDAGGSWIVTGLDGRGGEVGGLTNDRDGVVQKRTLDGRLLWDDVWRPDDPPTLDDRFFDAAISPITGNVLIVGHENLGFDNDAGSDLDGIAVSYDPFGYLGSPIFEWSPESRRWGGIGDQSMTAAAVDDAGDFYVAGHVDATGGGEQLRVVRLDALSGAELSRWEGPPHTQVRAEALQVVDERVLIAGWVDDGTGPDVHVVSLGVDSDGDGVADSNDGCPDDDDKIDPGVCGCDLPDSDSDSDGLLDCEDGCPGDADKTEPLLCGCGTPDDDDDQDGTVDCNDGCPDDPNKVDEGICGCGFDDDDLDGDGFVTCRDQCPDSEPGVEVDAVGCAVPEETGDTGAAPKPIDEGGCGCNASASPATTLALLAPFAAWLPLRRRRE